MPATYTDSIDGLTTSVAEKAPVVVATNGAITLSGEQTVNGVACVEGDRVLVKDQDDTTTNGIYVCADTAWSRALDFNGNRDVVKGTSVRVAGPSVSTGSLYIVTTENPIVIGTSAIVFVQKPEGTSESTLFVSMEDLRVSSTDQDYIETTSFYAGGTTGGAKLYRDGTGTPTGSGAAVIAAALAAGTFCNAAGNCYKLDLGQDITPYVLGAKGDGVADDTLFVAAWLSIETPLYAPAGDYLLTDHLSVVADRAVTIRGEGVTSRFFCADISDAAFNPGYGSNSVMFRFDVSDLLIEKVAFDSVAAVSYTETSAVGNFIFTDQTTTAYAQRITIKGCYFDRATNDAIYSGTFAGTGNDVYLDIGENHFFNSGRYDVTIQNGQQINIVGNFSRDSGAGFDVEPNGASDVALMVNVSGNNIKNAQYNAVQVTIGAPNTGVAIVSENAISLSTTYVATVTQKQPITVRAQYASINGNTMYEGSCARLIDLISTTHASITGNTMVGTSASSAELIRLTNSYAVMAGNFFSIATITNYATTSGTSGYKTIDHMAVNMIMGGAFENVLNLYGSSGLNSRAIMAIGNLRIDSNGLAASEFIRLRTKNGGVIGLEITDSGGLGAPNLPTSSAGLPAGGLWVDTGAANVIKRV